MVNFDIKKITFPTIMAGIEYVCMDGWGVVFVFSPLTNFTIEWASSLSLASATQRDAHHRLYPALTDNLSTAYNSPLFAPRKIPAHTEEAVKQSIYFQIQPCLSLVKLCFPPSQKCPFHLLNHFKGSLEASFAEKAKAGSQVVFRHHKELETRICS